MQSSDEKDYQDNRKIFYAAALNAWINTRLELDKQLLSLSVAAIGFLVALLMRCPVPDRLEFALFGSAFLAFMLTVGSVVFIFIKNADYLEAVIKEEQKEGKTLMILDICAKVSFSLGILLVIAIGYL